MLTSEDIAFKVMLAINGVKYLYDKQVEDAIAYACYGHVVSNEVKKEAGELVRRALNSGV